MALKPIYRSALLHAFVRPNLKVTSPTYYAISKSYLLSGICELPMLFRSKCGELVHKNKIK